jgi:hypothetical protein
MRKVFVGLTVLVVLLSTYSVVLADDPVEYTYDVAKDSHKVRNKWNLSGDFVAYPGYNWAGMAEGATWNYDFRIKEAMCGDYSVGMVHFWTGDIDVVGHVKATARDYNYWSGDEGNLAAVGTANYNDTTYYFMFLYAERAVWFSLSDVPYDTYWATEAVWPKSLRAYEVHSLNTNDYPLDYKMIH